ncbi:TKL/TKL-ccin protein kinase [Coprinopsis cinerea AmutBmut pab1-1]|nr:TKL/TKL-ccin protein kinase [Coprinopsis cinerea AmutBmut pab1-1]
MTSPPSDTSALTPRLRTTSLPQSTSNSKSAVTPQAAPAATLSPSSESSSDDEFPDLEAFRSRGQAPSSQYHLPRKQYPRSSPAIKIDGAGTDVRRAQSASASLASSLGSDLGFNIGRGRSLSPSSNPRSRDISPTPSAGLDASWWALPETGAPPWKDQPKRKSSIPASEVDGYDRTKERVALAVRSCLGNVVDVGHELLSIGVDLLELAPVPGLAPAARTLLNIWDAVDGVDVNFNRCLRLADRCARLLISIREEVREAGDAVGEELRDPIAALEEVFLHVLEFMRKQVRRPFLKRFLKRDETQEDIDECNKRLDDATKLFTTSIVIRILRKTYEMDAQRQKDTRAIIKTIISSSIPQTDPPLSPILLSPEDNRPTNDPSKEKPAPVTHFITTSNALGLSETIDISTIPPDNVIPLLNSLQESQNSLDRTNDIASLRQLMLKAIQASSDAEMIDMLQVKHEQMPDAIKTLQRALETIEKRRNQAPLDTIPPGVIIGKVKRRYSLKSGDNQEGGLQRSKTVLSIESTTSSKSTGGSSSAGGGSRRTRDTLEQEFIESGISALVRMSQGQNTNLPSWTITKFEINREKKIGVGGFSDVYRGTWKGRTVAIKVLKMETEKKLFIREVEIWKTLHHPHVLELYGASSALEPPWFFVSPYQKHGSLVDYLKKVARDLQDPALTPTFRPDRSPRKTSTIPLPLRSNRATSPTPQRSPLSPLGPNSPKAPLREEFKIRPEWDLLRFMHEIAKGMEYLHSRGVLHGDLKAANVLVDDSYRCVITDFGQSEMRSTAFRITGRQPTRGTLRWQAPEILMGKSELTREADVYAFAIACVEIINMGKLPWGSLLEDETIRNMVVKEDSRPEIAEDSRFNTPALQVILKACWNRDPDRRPPFFEVSKDLKRIRQTFENGDVMDTPKGSLTPLPEEQPPSSPSPDMKPLPLPPVGSPVGTAINILWPEASGGGHREETVANGPIEFPVPVFFKDLTPKPSVPISSVDDDVSDDIELVDLDYYPEVARVDATTAAVWNERRYRLLLTHDFHPSLVLPLWQPSAVSLGAVGYLSKPRGEFITLFNALYPDNSKHPLAKSFPSIHGYGKVEHGSQTRDTRSLSQKGWDSIAGLLSRANKNDHKEGDIPISRRFTYPLRAGHVSAHLCTQITKYVYLQDLKAAKRWFKANIDNIMHAYPTIQREDIYLVIGLLNTPNYGLFVSHSHPDGHVHFNVHKASKIGQPWGTFTTDSTAHAARNQSGPCYDEADTRPRIEASKVSIHGGEWETVLISRLRFRADEDEPTARV